MLNIYTVYIIYSLILTSVTKYLVINKIWLRKHEPAVADSVSIVALMLEFIILIPAFIVSIIAMDYGRIPIQLIILTCHIVVFFIGVGIWVNNGLGVKDKFARAFKVERKEYKSLLKEIVNPTGINKIFRFLCLFAVIDKKIHAKEEDLLRSFASEYNLDYEKTISEVKKAQDEQQDSSVLTMKNIYAQIKSYLKTSPPKQIIIYLADLIRKIVEVDKVVTEEEDIISSEILAALEDYLMNGKKERKQYHIIVVPQNDTQVQAVLAMGAELKSKKISLYGSEDAYVLDSYYSEKFAELVRAKYVDLFKCYVTVENY